MISVVGLDLSLTATGFARADGTTETLKTPLRDMERLSWLVTETVKRCTMDRADLIVIEDVPFGRNNAAGPLAMLHGALRLRLYHCNFQTAIPTAATLKKYATGKGNATKPDMRMALFKRADLDLNDDNQVDAWWLRAAGLEHYGTPALFVPQAQVDALIKVAWPELAITANT